MGNLVAAVIAGALIAVAILITNHWQLKTSSNDLQVSLRLNRWTGQVGLCVIDPESVIGSGRTLADAKIESKP